MARKTKMIKVDQEINKDHIVIALYARVSTDAQAEEGYSIDFQKEKLEAYAKSLPYVPEDIRLYVDDGYSGGSLERPQMQKLIIDAENNDITHVIVYKLDRLSRSQKDTLHLIEDIFIPHNIAFISISESFNTATAFGRAVIGILSVFAQLERENIYERTRSGMLKRVENGYWMGGGMIPFGYDYDRNQGILVKNKDSDIVAQIYNLYLKGYSEQRIADMFNMKYDRLVHQILVRKSNYGVIEYKGKEYKGLHEPIITKEIYDEAMFEMQKRSIEKRPQNRSTYLLAGFVYCGVCGARMRCMKWGKTDVKLVCYSKIKSRPYMVKDSDCDNDNISAFDIEDIVIADVFKMVPQIIASKDNNGYSVQDTLTTLKNKLLECNKKLERLYTLFSESENEEDDMLLSKIKELKREKENLQQQIDSENTLTMIANDRMRKIEELRNIEDVWPLLDIDEKRNILKTLIDKITITHDSVQIQYRF